MTYKSKRHKHFYDVSKFKLNIFKFIWKARGEQIFFKKDIYFLLKKYFDPFWYLKLFKNINKN